MTEGSWIERTSSKEDRPEWTVLRARKQSMKGLRLERGLTQAQLADLLEISNVRVSEIERNGPKQRISNIAEVIDRLGGKLKLVAEFDDLPLGVCRTENIRR